MFVRIMEDEKCWDVYNRIKSGSLPKEPKSADDSSIL